MSELKTKRTDADVNAYIASVADDRKRQDSEELLSLLREVTGEEPAMWGDSMIGFGHYAYTYASGHSGEWFKVGFAPRKRNLTLYILPHLQEHEELLEKLGKHKTGKSCLYVNKLSDIDTGVLRQLLIKSLAYFEKRAE